MSGNGRVMKKKVMLIESACAKYLLTYAGNCNKQVDSGSVTDHQDEIYCKSCYARLFGPKGYGYGIGAGVLSMDDGTGYQNGPPRSNIPATAKAYIAPLMDIVSTSTPASTNSALNNNNTSSNKSTLITDYSNGVVGKASASTIITTTIHIHAANKPPHNPLPAGVPKWGGGSYCTRCNKSVFMAERVMAAGGSWHKACFTCQECNKRLDSHSIRERARNIYCNPCYGKNFGPKGYWGWASAKVS
uniref:Cysteine and glycine-rich protein 1-like n=1 Tax=Hirondellea gigas TaxID=1518452 RepID=A0A6A7FTC3_9CRUS